MVKEKKVEKNKEKQTNAKPEKPIEKKEQSEEIEKSGGHAFLQTPIDKFVGLIKRNKKISFKALANELGWSIESVEKIGLVLEKRGVVDVRYPALVTSKPHILFVKELPSIPRYEINGILLEKYSYIIDFLHTTIEI